MKTLALLSVMFAVVSSVPIRGADPDITVAISVLPNRQGERTIEYNGHDPHFHVIVSNISDKPQKIWREWCSWGYYSLSFELSDKSGKKWVAKKGMSVWTKNYPDWSTLKPHESVVIDVYFADTGMWKGFPCPENGSQTVTMRAIFEIKPDDWSKKNGVWTGHVASKADKFTFYHWKPETK